MALRLAVVGAGPRGRQWAAALREAPGYEVVAWADLDRTRLEAAARRLGLPASVCHAGLEEALDAGHPEAVIVATSIHRHAEPVRVALTRRLGVLVEKPFTLDLAEARELVDLAHARDVPLVVGQSYRYTRTPRAIRGLLASQALGRVGMVVCQAYRDGADLSEAVAGVLDGLLWETAVHHVDALRYILADEAVGAIGQSFDVPWGRSARGGSFVGLLRFAGGARVSFSATYDSRGHERFRRGLEIYMRIVAERGTLHAFQHWLVLWPRGGWPRLVKRGAAASPECEYLLRQLERGLRHGEEPECSGRDNLKTLAVLEAWARSAREGQWVDPRELHG